jgi:hypothetical protein
MAAFGTYQAQAMFRGSLNRTFRIIRWGMNRPLFV